MRLRATTTVESATSLRGLIAMGVVVLISGAMWRAGVLADNVKLPQPVTADQFNALRENSPFIRSLNWSDSILLTGVAEIDGKPIATLFNIETRESYIVSEVPNSQGWKIVGIAQDNDLQKIVATISVSGGEVVTVRFDDKQLKPKEGKPPASAVPITPLGVDHRTQPTDEEVRKFSEYMQKRMSTFTDEQKARVREIILEKRKVNPNMTGRQKQDVYARILDYVESNHK